MNHNSDYEVTHLPELDDGGNPTDHALCDTGGGVGGVLAVPNRWRADCLDCLALDDEGVTSLLGGRRG